MDDDGWERELGRGRRRRWRDSAGRDPLVYHREGPGRPGRRPLRRGAVERPRRREDVNDRIGAGLGRLLDRVLREAELDAASIAGGDTSGHAAMRSASTR